MRYFWLNSIKMFLKVIRVKCIFYKNGCDEVLNYYELQAHQMECRKCPDCRQKCEDCHRYVPNYDMVRHKRVCEPLERIVVARRTRVE